MPGQGFSKLQKIPLPYHRQGSFLFCPKGSVPRVRRGQTLAPFPTIDDYYKIGESQSICCGVAKYFLKESTLTLTAYIGNKQITTIEISLDDYHIIQCRAFANGICEYTEQIAGIINANKKMIAERERA